jgi:hypothetical protein
MGILRRIFGLEKDIGIHLYSSEYEFIEVKINNQDMPPGNMSEIVLPYDCIAMQGIIYGKWTKIFISHGVKVIAIPRSELERIEKENKEKMEGNIHEG